ncbi:MAG: hypothetical protein K2X38_22240 [Gemmataceae bacterium]|nr:hypothetical protein [Gemmataceae bacterium]
MEQKFDGPTPRAEIRLEGRRVIRTEVTHDWGLRLQWVVKRNGQKIATPNARLATSYEHAETTAGEYEVFLQMWKYVDYAKNPQGEFTKSQFIDVSNKVTYRI